MYIQYCNVMLTLAGNHQFHYLTGKHELFNVTVAAKFSMLAKIKYTKFVAYRSTFLRLSLT